MGILKFLPSRPLNVSNTPDTLIVQLTVQQIKAEMEKTLQWLVPMATNTTK